MCNKDTRLCDVGVVQNINQQRPLPHVHNADLRWQLNPPRVLFLPLLVSPAPWALRQAAGESEPYRPDPERPSSPGASGGSHLETQMKFFFNKCLLLGFGVVVFCFFFQLLLADIKFENVFRVVSTFLSDVPTTTRMTELNLMNAVLVDVVLKAHQLMSARMSLYTACFTFSF